MRRILIVFLILLILMPSISYANSAEPPSIRIVVNSFDKDIDIRIDKDNSTIDDYRVSKSEYFGEVQYAFYVSGLKRSSEIKFLIEYKNELTEILLSDKFDNYNNNFYLNVNEMILSSNDSVFRIIKNLLGRMMSTLAIEFLVLLLIGYRKRNSFKVFLITNIISQLGLNVYLLSEASVNGYLIFLLAFGEIFVLLFEIIIYRRFLTEQGKTEATIFAVLANIASIYLGSYVLMYFPVF